jgi:hypothetical protein
MYAGQQSGSAWLPLTNEKDLSWPLWIMEFNKLQWFLNLPPSCCHVYSNGSSSCVPREHQAQSFDRIRCILQTPTRLYSMSRAFYNKCIFRRFLDWTFFFHEKVSVNRSRSFCARQEKPQGRAFVLVSSQRRHAHHERSSHPFIP